MTEREKLVEELIKLWTIPGSSSDYVESIADFIIADRKRIVSSVVKELEIIQRECSDKMTDLDEVDQKLTDLIEEVKTNAGVS